MSILYEGFQIRDDCDKAIIDAIYRQDHYGVKKWAGTPFVEPETMIDLGAHIGSFSRLWHELQPQSKIIAVTSEKEDCTLLQQNIGDFADVHFGVCTHLPWAPKAGTLKFTLDALAYARFVDCVKIDIEGFEFDVFENVNKETMERVMAVVGEVHDGERGLRRLRMLFESRFPWFINFNYDPGLSHFSVYNPYYWFRRRCEL
jgi:hypothetical protein